MPRKKPVNPFYVLLVLVGIAFCVTASAYGLMTYRATHAVASVSDRGHTLWPLFDEYGAWLLAVELALLTLFTIGAIATDEYGRSRSNPGGDEPRSQR